MPCHTRVHLVLPAHYIYLPSAKACSVVVCTSVHGSVEIMLYIYVCKHAYIRRRIWLVITLIARDIVGDGHAPMLLQSAPLPRPFISQR